VRLAPSTHPVVSFQALSCMCVATRHAAGRAALLSLDGATAALEAGMARLRAAPLERDRAERARREELCGVIAAALGRLRDPRARQEHGPPPADAPQPGSDGVVPLGGLPVVCIACGSAPAPGRPLQQCGACRGPERWCGAACQRATWAAHKPECRERTAGAAAAGGPAGAGGSG
jgi:hypothetical protein